MYACMSFVCGGCAHRSQMKESYPLKLELQTAVNFPTSWTGTKQGSSGIAIRTLNGCAISQAPQKFSWWQKSLNNNLAHLFSYDINFKKEVIS